MDNATLLEVLQNVSSSIDRYKKMDKEMRFLMLIDKFHWSIDITKIILSKEIDALRPAGFQMNPGSNTSLIKKYETLKECLDVIKDEISELENFIQDKKNGQMERIEQKLDDVLLGPDYPEGKKLMEECKEDFLKILEENNV